MFSPNYKHEILLGKNYLKSYQKKKKKKKEIKLKTGKICNRKYFNCFGRSFHVLTVLCTYCNLCKCFFTK